MTTRIESGLLKGMKLTAPKGRAVTRPTSSKVRAAVFDILRGELAGAKVLDLYAGVGSFGIGALSQGAKMAFFVEQDKETFRCLQRNLDEAKARVLEGQAQTQAFRQDVFAFLAKNRLRFDLIWLDPPYKQVEDDLPRLLAKLSEAVNQGGFILIESHRRFQLNEDTFAESNLILESTRNYGKTLITILKRG